MSPIHFLLVSASILVNSELLSYYINSKTLYQQIFGVKAQLVDYSTIQTSLNQIISNAENDLQKTRFEISAFLLKTTDDMIDSALDSVDLNEMNEDFAAMVGACTLYPTNWLNFETRNLNAKLAETQALVNSMKFVVLRGLVNQPMISQPDATYQILQTQADAAVATWESNENALLAEVNNFKARAEQLKADLKECIAIIDK